MNTRTLQDYSLDQLIDDAIEKVNIDAQAKITGHFGDQHNKNALLAQAENDHYQLTKQILEQVKILSAKCGEPFEIDEQLLKQMEYNQRRAEYCAKIKNLQKIMHYKLEQCRNKKCSKQEVKAIINSFDDKWPEQPTW